MSSKGVVVALLLTIALALVTMVVLLVQGAGAGSAAVVPPGERLVPNFGTASVEWLEVETPGGGVDRVQHDRAPGEWTLETGRGTPAARTWPVDAERFRSVLRVLAETRAAGTPEAGAGVGPGPTLVRWAFEGGGEVKLSLAARRLGGQGLVEVAATAPGSAQGSSPSRRVALAADSLHNLFTAPGPRGWRRTQLLPGVAVAAASVRMITPDASLALAREAGVWSLREPVAAPADPEAVRRLFSTLEQVHVARFLDDASPKPADAGLDTPIARVVIGLEQRTAGAAGVEVQSVTRELTLGGKADAGGQTLFATADEGRTVVAVEAAGLSTLSTDPTRWISPTALSRAAADVAVLMFKGEARAAATPAAPGTGPVAAGAGGAAVAVAAPVELGFRRTLDGWVELRPDGTQVLQDSSRAEQIAALLNLLTATKAQAISLSAPAAYEAVGTLSVRGTDGAVIEELTLARTATPGVTIRTGPVFRSYTSVPTLVQGVLGPVEAVQAPAVDKVK